MQAEVRLERVKVAIAVQQTISIDDASGCDDDVDGSTHRHAVLAEPAKISRGGHCNLFTAQSHLLQPP